MPIRKSLTLAISRWLCPAAHEHAERYDRLRHRLDEARWWLGAEFPEPAALAHHLLDDDFYHWTGEKPIRDPHWTWQPPPWVTGVDGFRQWLRSDPFRARVDPPPHTGEQTSGRIG